MWSSTALVGIGTQMESAVLGWFVLSLTDSPFLVGSIAAARMALNFLALFAGAIADRLPRNLLLVPVEFLMGITGILMLALILTDLLEVWHIFVITLLLRTTQQEFRGRIMGLRSFAILAYSFGSMAAGAIAGVWGAPVAAQVVGFTGITLVLVVAAVTPKLRAA